MPVPGEAPRKKARRVSRACDFCNHRSIKCKASSDPTRCQNCIDFDQACTYNRVTKRRGVKPRSDANSPSIGTPAREVSNKPEQWQAPNIASQAAVMDMVEIYFEIVYPIFPFFHRPTFIRKIARAEHHDDRYLFAVTMAMCALVAGRISDGAIFNPRWDTDMLLQHKTEKFYDAAFNACRYFSPGEAYDLNLLRASALLAIASIQYGDSQSMQFHLGTYHQLVGINSLHDEDHWPRGIGIVEVEERRRLFWSVYTLELFTSIVWSSVIRCREQQCNVLYPTEIDDEHFDDSGYRSSAESPLVIGPSPSQTGTHVQSKSWLSGWNFTTDLYRILEHVITHFRDRRRGKRSFLTEIFGDRTNISAAAVRDSIMNMYANLPRCFKETQPITCDMTLDRYGFQAANITATVQLLRMVLFSSGGGSLEERCRIASEVVEAFVRIPVAYLQAISSPLLHHLAGIGAILGSVFEEPLTESGYQQVRIVLLTLAQLLENLDHGIHSTGNADKLRNQVARIDEYMENQRNNNRSTRRRRTPSGTDQSSTYNLERRFSGSEHSTTAPSSVPYQLPAELLENWPWDLDFMQFPEN